MQWLHLPSVEHEGVLPVVDADPRRRRRDAVGRGPAGAVPARVPNRARPGLVPEHRRVRAPGRAAHRRD